MGPGGLVGEVGTTQPGKVCEPWAGSHEAAGEPRKTEGEPICSTLSLLEVVSLQKVLGTGDRAGHGGAVGILCP